MSVRGQWPTDPERVRAVFEVFDVKPPTSPMPITSLSDIRWGGGRSTHGRPRFDQHKWVFGFRYGPKHQRITAHFFVEARTPTQLIEAIESRGLLGVPSTELALPRKEAELSYRAAFLTLFVAFNPGLFLRFRAWVTERSQKEHLKTADNLVGWEAPPVHFAPPENLGMQRPILFQTQAGINLWATWTSQSDVEEMVLHGQMGPMEKTL